MRTIVYIFVKTIMTYNCLTISIDKINSKCTFFSPSASKAKIKEAHKRIMLLNHPDKGRSLQTQVAHIVLSDCASGGQMLATLKHIYLGSLDGNWILTSCQSRRGICACSVHCRSWLASHWSVTNKDVTFDMRQRARSFLLSPKQTCGKCGSVLGPYVVWLCKLHIQPSWKLFLPASAACAK